MTPYNVGPLSAECRPAAEKYSDWEEMPTSVHCRIQHYDFSRSESSHRGLSQPPFQRENKGNV